MKYKAFSVLLRETTRRQQLIMTIELLQAPFEILVADGNLAVPRLHRVFGEIFEKHLHHPVPRRCEEYPPRYFD